MKPLKPKVPRELQNGNNLADRMRADETITGYSFASETVERVKNQSVSIQDSRLYKVNLLGFELKAMSLLDVDCDNCEWSAIKLAGLSAERVEWRGCRMSGVQMHEGKLKDVSFVDCKLDLANFRFVKFERVEFKDCVLNEADFSNAEFQGVNFVRCELDKADFSLAKIKKLDLRSSNIVGVNGIAGMKGAMISPTQLIGIAPHLAYEIGIVVEED